MRCQTHCPPRGSAWPARIAAGVVVAVVVDALSAVLATIATFILVSAVLLAGAGMVTVLAVLRASRTVLWSPVPPPAVRDGQSPALAAARPAAIEGTRAVVVPGYVVHDDQEPMDPNREAFAVMIAALESGRQRRRLPWRRGDRGES